MKTCLEFQVGENQVGGRGGEKIGGKQDLAHPRIYKEMGFYSKGSRKPLYI